jgi:transposase InsO family protein
MIQFIEDHRADLGVEPICRVLPIAPATFYDHLAKRVDPSRLSDRAVRDAELKPEIERVFEANLSVYGVRKIWRQMRREGFDIARCTVARLMKGIGIEGVIRGKKPRTTIPDKALPCPLDRVNRQFHAPAPNVLWVSDFTYVATWQGFVYVAFVIDVFARRIVGWRASRTASAGFVLDALEQAIHQRRPSQDKLVHHSDRGSQYLSIKYTERLAEAKIAPSVGSVGDCCDNALAKTINGLFKAEVIHRRGPWRSFKAVEYATLEWVDYGVVEETPLFNNRRLLEPIGNIPPAEAEANFYAALERSDLAA